MSYDRLTDKQEGILNQIFNLIPHFISIVSDCYILGKIICISWDSTGEWLVTGSINAVRIYSRRSGHAVHKLPTGQSETIVSSIAVTKDFTIISADSR